MKAINTISHPLILIIAFSLILISGQHLGGVYLLYILLALPQGSIHAVLAVSGICILIFSNYKYKGSFTYLIEPLLNIAGVILLILSLFFFFQRDSRHYNDSTFYQLFPQVSLAVFVILAIIFLINNLVKIRQVAT